ncbi:hypothetical protein ACP3T3_17010 [Chryseobacterium sp. CBSDS_008]|uniref:hypothetical protein n=1 Tax=Chryseobacterium sp. CBSDS_008 TaxID=3415265 RepID=UPI003CF792EF
MLITAYYIISFIVLIKGIVVLRVKKLSSQDYFLLYLAVNFGVDFFSEINIIPTRSIQYNYLNLFNSFYFIIFYFRHIKNKKIAAALSTAVLIAILLNTELFYTDKYNLNIAITYCVINILQVLYWCSYKLNNINTSKITDDPIFWISASILLWSCFFLFRITPMYLLNEIDKPFLKLLKQILNIINIVCCGLFYIALHKYNSMDKK